MQSQSGYGVDLVGPTLKTHWYQAETGYDLTHFSINWEAETVTCPQGRMSSSWTPVQDAGKSLIKVKFSASVIVRSVRLKPPVQEPLAAPSPYTQESRCRHCLQHASGRRRMSLRTSIIGEQALKEFIRKASASEGIATLTLYWPAQNPSGPSRHCRSHE
jgi:hypothetical protein